jgi:hypothetical protein
MEERYNELTTYQLIKKYRTIKEKESPEAKELENLIRNDLKLSANADFNSIEVHNQLSEIVRKSRLKNERFINIIAWIFIALTGLSFLGSGCSLIRSDFDAKLSKFVDSQLFKNINPYMQFMLQHHLLITIIGSLFFVLAFFASVGILYRSNLARKVAIIFLIIKIIQNFLEPILVKYVYPTVYDFKYDLPKSVADSMYKSSVIMSVFLSAVFIILYSWLIYKFNSPEIKEEFD